MCDDDYVTYDSGDYTQVGLTPEARNLIVNAKWKQAYWTLECDEDFINDGTCQVMTTTSKAYMDEIMN